MATVRIKNITTTATSPSGDDFVAIDGATSNTRKINAGPLGGNFDENVVVEFGGNKTTYASNFLRSENGSYYIDAYTTGGDIVFRTSVASALDTQSMIIDGATGRVAIGLSSPDAKLHVVSSAASGGTFKFVDGSSRTLQDLSGGALSWSAASVIGGTSWAGTADHEIKTLTTARDTLLVTGPASGTEYGLHVTGLQSLFDGKLGIGGNLEFNSGADLKIFHDGSNGYIQNVTGDLNLKNASTEYLKGLVATGGVELFHNGTKQCETVSTGLSFPSGKGIDFSATGDGSGTMTSELLDDYEEGTWTPVFTPSGGSFAAQTMNVVAARYVKVGHQVTVNCYIQTTNLDTTGASGQVMVTGLPYANAGSNNFVAAHIGYAIDWTEAPSGGYINQSSTQIVLNKRYTGITGSLSPMDVNGLNTASGTKNTIMLTATYNSF
jgi:hypothetical protein